MDCVEIERMARAHNHRGSIEVICGSMFSGKTEELMRRLRRASIAQLNVEIYKPSIDTRYDDQNIVSHDARSLESTAVENAQMILLLGSNADVIGIDEAQFFDESIEYVVAQLADDGKRVIIAGLDLDYRRTPFGSMPSLMAMADSVTKVHAVCMDCGGPANYSYRLTEEESQILLGELNDYRPLCRHCYLQRVAYLRK